MEAHYIGFKMWVQAVEQAGTTDVDAVRQAMYGQKVKPPGGFSAVMNTNHHLSKPVMIGEIQATGSSTSCGRPRRRSRPTPGALSADKGKIADWTLPLGLRQLHRAEMTRTRVGTRRQRRR